MRPSVGQTSCFWSLLGWLMLHWLSKPCCLAWGLRLHNGSSCNIVPTFTSPFIMAKVESTVKGYGCHSNQSTNASQEVHIISLVHNGRQAKNSADVYLEIVPYTKGEMHSGPLIFVLSSQRHVSWKIRLAKIADTPPKHLFLVHLRSSIRFINHFSNVEIIKRGDLPTRYKVLMKWVEKNYHAVTSFTEFKEQAKNIRAKVGIAPVAPKVCNVHKMAVTPHVALVSYEPISFGGCSVTRNHGYTFRTIYIIELVGAGGSPLNEVIVEIKSQNGKLAHVEIALILKAKDNVHWIIRSRKILGDIEIAANSDVNTDGVNVRRVAQRKERHLETGRDLIKWVKDYIVGTVSFYANISHADKVFISVEGTSQDQSHSLDSSKTLPSSHSIELSPFSQPALTKQSIQSAMKTSCLPDGMVVTVDKTVAKKFGIEKEQLTLANPSCRAEDFGTHYILRTSYTKCQTTSKGSPPKYSNKLQIHPVRPVRWSTVPQIIEQESSGWGEDNNDDDDDDNASGSGSLIQADDTRVDDEDFQFQSISLDFSCTPPDQEEEPRDLDFHLNFYEDALFLRKIIHFPHYIPLGKTIYAKATLSDSSFGLQMLNCWLSPSRAGDGNSIQPLIKNGCNIVQQSVHWCRNYDSKNKDWSQQFSFKIGTHLDASQPHFLNCELSACSKQTTITSTWKMTQCLEPEDFCIKSQSGYLMSGHYMTIVNQGPLIFENGATDLHVVNVPRRKKNEVQQKIVIEGLDSATVIGIAFAAFIIGILLTATLWFIHTYTATPNKRSSKSRTSAESSVESSPCSFSVYASDKVGL